ncbi:hypothetical protein HU200_063341 [Digitaria exilis]|uniref:Uncharacterized protein n=1 Tax=Digitaria exilis TaxID=1010633 RepID=A0A835AE75_9POAL|nr:hypothetical protein HU200_063341 [Digitaria exilis]
MLAQQQRKYLHLVLNDWDSGYSIYRVGEDDFDINTDMDAPRPAVSPLIRIVAQHGYSWSFASHGTQIMAMHPAESSPGIPVFDTKTLGMTVCPYPLSRDCGSKPLYASVGGRLLAFVYPFLESGTFTFDMESHKWTHIGDWLLPFRGRAYYDPELDAWVGLCFYKRGAGHICCCDVPPATGCMTMPVWKLGVEIFFDENSKRHLGATLVYMDNSRFCLVESWMPQDDDFYPRLRVVKITSFLLKYGKEGELRVSGRCTYGSMSYQIPHKHGDVELNPVAFWM